MQFKNEKEATGLSRRHFTHIVWVFDLVVLGHNAREMRELFFEYHVGAKRDS
jgi:hypothetical protein